MPPAPTRAALVVALQDGGFVAAEEEADELLLAAGDDPDRVSALLARRLTGEPLAWIVGSVDFCGLRVRIDPGVYVPRVQTEWLAERAARLLPPAGTAVDVCCGSGAIAAVLRARRPGARVVACDADPRAVACARANGVNTHVGDLLDALPGRSGLQGAVDVLVGVVPYVPTDELAYLQRDTFTFEEEAAYHGGPDGTDVLRRVVRDGAGLLRPGGRLLLELGADLAGRIAGDLAGHGLRDVVVVRDEDGDVRAVEAVLARRRAR